MTKRPEGDEVLATSRPQLGRLSTIESWEDIWSGEEISVMPRLSCARGLGRDLRKKMNRHLQGMQGRSFIEFGCYPGRFLRFFADFFGLRVDGVEYVETRARDCQKLLGEGGYEGRIYSQDVFEWRTEEVWDVVSSFGFVEHFQNTEAVLRRHVDLAAPGGLVVVTFPNHAGLYGWIMSKVAPEHHARHNQMSRRQAVDAVRSIPEADLLEASHIGRIGFGASRLYEWASASPRKWPKAISFAARILERIGSVLPNSPFLSPHVLLVIRVQERN